VEALVVDDEVSRHYAEIVADLRKAGTPLPTNDIWIAATAARAGSLVLTFDSHFEKVSRVGAVVLEV
jgi:predicted nucleic acid-binding protein